MARTALLTETQCNKIRTLKANGARAVELAKRFKVSESSLYKVLDGSYQARPDDCRPTLPVVVADKPKGITPSLFNGSSNRRRHMDPVMDHLLEQAQHIDDIELDDLTVAAAELVVAKARLNRVLHRH